MYLPSESCRLDVVQPTVSCNPFFFFFFLFYFIFFNFLSPWPQDMGDYIAYVAKDLFNQRGKYELVMMMSRHLYLNQPPNQPPNQTNKQTNKHNMSLLQRVTSWSVLGVKPERLLTASDRLSRGVFANSSGRRHHSSPPVPGSPCHVLLKPRWLQFSAESIRSHYSSIFNSTFSSNKLVFFKKL